MRIDWTKAAERWLSEFGWAELERSSFTQVDIDWFSDELPARPVPAATECVGAAFAIANVKVPRLEPVITIPLGCSDALDTHVPEIAPILHSDWRYGPGLEVVGLYLIGPEQRRVELTVEEYRRPVELGLPSASYSAYYRCWRNTSDPRVEYDRAIYLRPSLPL